MPLALVTTSERPDLVPVTARWRWEAFLQGQGRSLAEVTAAEAARAPGPMPRTCVLLADDEPVGMASLASHDLETRPDLTPWLAGVYVAPQARGRGHAVRLVAAVEADARSLGVRTLWLYTRNAEGLYARIGWETVERFSYRERMYALMRRELVMAG